ncbi:bifunctional precorrin-2 dehydrogenase/sirohydrochlorin ferrochelatase [Ferroplasma sp.]|uniref:precorrin-2 dehydrogenase/sirohydrochlorin ferrochelatase family protein n=1 Tax=Ferroplasma sp. TaxID=2591003 RepID=UPI00307D8405
MMFNIKLNGKKILFAGGGRIAERKIKKLLSEGANITVISPEVTDYISDLGKAGKINIIKREITGNDIQNAYFMVLCTTNNPEVNKEISYICKKNNILHDDTGNHINSDIMMVSSKKINGITLSISTCGNNPAISKKLIDFLDNDLISNSMDFENYIKIIYASRM